jgi:hypothetical protein
MKSALIALAFLALAVLTAPVFGAPAYKVTNRQFEDGGGSSKVVDPDKKQAIESFITGSGKLQYRIIYALDDRLQPVSGVYYNAAGRVFQKSAYKLDGADRIIQEVVYDANDKLVCTKNYVYGNRGGRDNTVIAVDTYDANGSLMASPKRGAPTRRR